MLKRRSFTDYGLKAVHMHARKVVYLHGMNVIDDHGTNVMGYHGMKINNHGTKVADGHGNKVVDDDSMSDEVIPRCGLLVGCLASQQHASVSQGRICTENFKCCHTEIEAAVQTFYLNQSQHTDTTPTSPSADPITPGRVATGVPIFKSLV